MSDFVQWENLVIAVGTNTDMLVTLNKFGEEGWEPWAVLGAVQAPDGTQAIQIGLKRHKRKIIMASNLQGALSL